MKRTKYSKKTTKSSILFTIVSVLIILPVMLFITQQKQQTVQHAASKVTYPATDGNILWTGDWSSGTTDPWSIHAGGSWGDSKVDVVTSPVKWGNYSGKLTLNSGSGNVRAEITSSQSSTGGYAGQQWYYSFSVYFPSDPDKTTGWGNGSNGWTDFTQWMDERANCSPPLQYNITPQSEITFHYELDSQESGNCGYGSYPSHDYDLGPVVYDQWINFTARIKWSEDPAVGSIQVWRDGKEMVPVTNIQTFDPNSTGVYMEQAMYRPNPGGTSVVYFSGTRRHDAYDPASDAGGTTPVSITPSVSSTTVTTTGSQSTGTALGITVCPHGIGNCGDNTNPSYPGNTTPKHTQRPVTVHLVDAANNSVGTLQGNITYNASSQNYLGTVSLGAIPTGNYLVSIQTPGYLAAQSSGITHVTSGTTTTVPSTALVAGDVNGDNQIDIIDYNDIISCYGSKQTTSSCITGPNTTAAGSDINDDGTVNATDYNLFLRELSVQKGR